MRGARTGGYDPAGRPVILRFEQSVAAPREALFAFHTNPANLGLLLDGWLLDREGLKTIVPTAPRRGPARWALASV